MPIDFSSIIYFFNAYDNFCRILYVDCHVCDRFLCVLADINVITEGEPDSLLKLVLSQSSDGKLSHGSEFYVVSPKVYLVPSKNQQIGYRVIQIVKCFIVSSV